MAKKLEQANNAVLFSKNQTNKYVRLGSGNERNTQPTISKKNTSQLLKSKNSSEYKENNKSNENYKQLFLSNKISITGAKKRIGSPATDINENIDENEEIDNDPYYEKQTANKMPKKNLRLNSGNYRMEPLNQYPFPLTPLDKASNKPIEFEENMAAVKSQSTRNKYNILVTFVIAVI